MIHLYSGRICKFELTQIGFEFVSRYGIIAVKIQESEGCLCISADTCLILALGHQNGAPPTGMQGANDRRCKRMSTREAQNRVPRTGVRLRGAGGRRCKRLSTRQASAKKKHDSHHWMDSRSECTTSATFRSGSLLSPNVVFRDTSRLWIAPSALGGM